MPTLIRSDIPGAAHYRFICPGCKDWHSFSVRDDGHGWTFNGDMERPTISPSLLVTNGHYVAGQEGKRCWCQYNAEHPDEPAPFICYRCHSFIADGQIQFLADSTHELADKTVPLESITPLMTGVLSATPSAAATRTP